MRKSGMQSDKAQPPPRFRGLTNLFASCCEEIGSWLEANEYLALSILWAILLVATFIMAVHRPFWFDEVYTMMVSTRPDLHTLLSSLPGDGNPPLLHLVIRFFSRFIHKPELAGRLPSALAFWASCLLMYLIVRRRTGVVTGFFATAFVMSQSGWAYSYEARPYALLLFFTTLTMGCWQIAAERRTHRNWALLGMSLGFCGASLSHHLGLFQIVIIVLTGEVWRLYRSHSPDWGLYSTVIWVIPILAYTIPLAHRTQDAFKHLTGSHYNSLSLLTVLHWPIAIVHTSHEVVGLSTTFVLPLICWALWREFGRNGMVKAQKKAEYVMPEYEIVAAIAAVATLPITGVLMLAMTTYFNCRYSIGALAGVAIVSAFSLSLLPTQTKQKMTVALIAICLVVFVCSFSQNLARVRPIDKSELVVSEQQKPIVFDKAFPFLTLWWYSTPLERNRLYFAYQANQRTEIAEASVIMNREIFPIQAESLGSVISNHRSFTAIFENRESSDYLRSAGYTLRATQTKFIYDASIQSEP